LRVLIKKNIFVISIKKCIFAEKIKQKNMNTAVIEINNDLAYSFLYNLERMNLLRVVSRQNQTTKNKQKLSERFAGSLTSQRVDELQNELKNMRDEWKRDIY